MDTMGAVVVFVQSNYENTSSEVSQTVAAISQALRGFAFSWQRFSSARLQRCWRFERVATNCLEFGSFETLSYVRTYLELAS